MLKQTYPLENKITREETTINCQFHATLYLVFKTNGSAAQQGTFNMHHKLHYALAKITFIFHSHIRIHIYVRLLLLNTQMCQLYKSYNGILQRRNVSVDSIAKQYVAVRKFAVELGFT